MIDIKIISIGKIKKSYFRDALDEYLKRLQPYARIKFTYLKANSFNKSNQEQIKIEESIKILKHLEKYNDEEIFLLHETGKDFNSLEFANFINCQQKIIFVIGGSLGFSEELLSKYQQISFSKLTFLHEMVSVILLEQLYRAITIFQGKEYHH